jgi:hypothetical protein
MEMKWLILDKLILTEKSPAEFRRGFRRRVISLLLVTLLFPSEFAFAWGNEGHLYINQVAAQKIPADMPRFLHRAVAELTYLGPEPDRWRSSSEPQLKNAQEPDHFIDLERVAWLDPLPATRYEFYRKLYEKRAAASPNHDRPDNDHPDDYLPERVGLQPYITLEIFGRLKAAFREYRHLREQHKPTAPVEHAIVFYAGWLGHYVADGSQPLHTTIQYNGWTGPNPNNYTTQHKIHALFETTYVSQNITAKDFASQVHVPEHLTDPFQQYVAYLRESNGKVETVYALEKAGGFTGKGTPEAFTFTTQRLAAGSQMLLNLWYTAWQDSAINPEPPHP